MSVSSARDAACPSHPLNKVVVPPSALSCGRFLLPLLIYGLIIHSFGIGIPAVIIVSEPTEVEG